MILSMSFDCRAWIARVAAGICASFVVACASKAQPPAYSSYGRDQRIDYTPDPSKLLRIWMVYVGQGDGILIQFPSELNYDADENGSREERIDLLIDGGAHDKKDVGRMREFIESLYPEGPILEHVVVSHHDADHVTGLTAILRDTDWLLPRIYHNGLASWRGGVRDIPETTAGNTADLVYKATGGQIGRALGRFPVKRIRSEDLIDDLAELRGNRQDFATVYGPLATAILDAGGRVSAFPRVFTGAPFVNEADSRTAPVGLTLLWPPELPRKYRDWGYTINGNSVTFRLNYGAFSMLFTGDHNEESEREMLADYRNGSKLAELTCDVLKVPHHGSSHNLEDIFRPNGERAVVSIASMGDKGFGHAWKHPSAEVIKWAGGAKHIYHTHIHEWTIANWSTLTDAQLAARVERSHVMVETDGAWFRVVEIPVDAVNLIAAPPAVELVKRGNGTRWIRAE